MVKQSKMDYASAISRIFPLILREFHSRQEGILNKIKNITFSHILVLDVLNEKSQCTMGELSTNLKLTMSAVTPIIDRMIEVGYVARERSVNDRRIVNVVITKTGEKVIGQINDFRKELANEVYSVFTEDEREEYLRLLTKLYNKLKGQNE